MSKKKGTRGNKIKKLIKKKKKGGQGGRILLLFKQIF